MHANGLLSNYPSQLYTELLLYAPRYYDGCLDKFNVSGIVLNISREFLETPCKLSTYYANNYGKLYSSHFIQHILFNYVHAAYAF